MKHFVRRFILLSCCHWKVKGTPVPAVSHLLCFDWVLTLITGGVIYDAKRCSGFNTETDEMEHGGDFGSVPKTRTRRNKAESVLPEQLGLSSHLDSSPRRSTDGQSD